MANKASIDLNKSTSLSLKIGVINIIYMIVIVFIALFSVYGLKEISNLLKNANSSMDVTSKLIDLNNELKNTQLNRNLDAVLGLPNTVDSIEKCREIIAKMIKLTNSDEKILEIENKTKILYQKLDKGEFLDAVQFHKNDIMPLLNNLENILKEQRSENVERVVLINKLAVEKNNKYIIFYIIMIALAIAISFVIYLLVNKNITVPIKEVCQLLERRGQELKEMTKNMNNICQGLSISTTKSAQATQECSSAMMEIEKILDNANEKAHVSKKAAENVEKNSVKGDEVMDRMVSSVQLIEESNKHLIKISQIMNEVYKKTDVINQIVFNTKILSFNAAIEASRAGIHGRGFGVVAEEINLLAGSSGKAAQSVQELLDNSKKDVELIVKGMANSMVEAKKNIGDGIDIFAEISKQIREINEKAMAIVLAGEEGLKGVKMTSISLGELGNDGKVVENYSTTIYGLSKNLSYLNNNIYSSMRVLEKIVYGGNK
ncbi:MAG: hypothetical protein HQK49_13600 [Oligoflexia bacterium]|nr:hypothetical protein [Oligoflexia bacterium]